MKDDNKRKREDEPYYMQNTHSYQGICNSTISNVQTSSNEQNSPFGQPLVLNQTIIQNQQLFCQLQRASEQQQNLVYLLVPANENIQVQPVPVTVLPNDPQQNVAGQQYVGNLHVNSQNNRDRNDSSYTGAEKHKLLDIKEEYFPERQTKNVQFSFNASKETAVKSENNSNTYSLYTKHTVLKDHGNTSKPHLYRCDYKLCSESFYSLYEKKLHLDTHIFPESNEFKCSICNMIFEKAIDRNKHVESHCIAPTYKCKQCQKHFAYYTVLVKHLEEKKCNVKNPVSCYFCETKIVDIDELIKHHQLNMKQCRCGVKCCGNQAYELHLGMCGYLKSTTKVQAPFERKKNKARKAST